MKDRIRFSIGWIGLIAYLFLCLANFQTAIALLSGMTGPHGIEVTQDGNHQDIVFTHHLPHHHIVQEHGQAHHHHQASEDDLGLLFDSHHQSHPDHVVHLPQHQEQLSVQVPAVKFDLKLLSDIDLSTVVTLPLQHFFEIVSLQLLPNPPPRPSAIHTFLKTVVLLI